MSFFGQIFYQREFTTPNIFRNFFGIFQKKFWVKKNFFP